MIHSNRGLLRVGKTVRLVVLYNGGEPRRLSYAEIKQKLKIGFFSGIGKIKSLV